MRHVRLIGLIGFRGKTPLQEYQVAPFRNAVNVEKPKAKGQRPKARDKKQEARSQKSEVRSQKSEVRRLRCLINCHPGFFEEKYRDLVRIKNA